MNYEDRGPESLLPPPDRLLQFPAPAGLHPPDPLFDRVVADKLQALKIACS